MKIIYVLACEIIPIGAVRIVVEHCNRLAARGHEVYLATPNKGADRLHPRPDCIVPKELEDLIGGFDIQKAPPGYPLNESVTLVSLDEIPSLEPFDAAVGTGWGTWPLTGSIRASRHYGLCQMVEHLNFPENYIERGRNFFKELMLISRSSTFKLIALSSWIKDYFLQVGRKDEDVIVLPYGVDFDKFYPDIDPTFIKEKESRKGKVILIPGYEMNQSKNIRDAWTVANRVKNNIDVQIWGFSLVPASLRYDLYAQEPSQDTIRKIYSVSDVMLQTSVYEARGGLYAVEAMACGCPVVATYCGGVEDLIPEKTCLSTAQRDLDSLIEATTRILTGDKLAARLKHDALEYVHKELTWDPIIDKLEVILSE